MPVYKSKNNSGTVNPLASIGTVRGGQLQNDFTPNALVPGLFTKEDQAEAMKEGWFVGKDSESGMYDILDNLTLTFSTPAEARAWVEARADQGSDLHERALAATVALTIRNAGK